MRDLKNILNNIKQEPKLTKNDRVLIIDGLNMFFRSFMVINTVNYEGNHTGGMTGFLKSLGMLVRTIRPTRVIVVFDGEGSSQARKRIDSRYKANRENSTAVVNWDVFDNKEESEHSTKNQLERLGDYLSALPVHVLRLPKLEADDIIAYLCTQYGKFKSSIIVSSDKDFLQLASDSVEIYRPIQKEFMTKEKVVQKFKVLPQNFAIYRAILGDTSDNLGKIEGVGGAGLIKLIPEFGKDPEFTLKKLFKLCEEKLEDNKKYAKILAGANLVETNYRVMDLNHLDLFDKDKEHIEDVLESSTPRLNKMAFITLMAQDKVEGSITTNPDSWLETFRSLTYLD